MAALKNVLIVLCVLAALFVCIGSGVGLWGLSGFRGEVCSDLGDLPGIVDRTGRLTHCDQRTGVTNEPSVSVFDVLGFRAACWVGRVSALSVTGRCAR